MVHFFGIIYVNPSDVKKIVTDNSQYFIKTAKQMIHMKCIDLFSLKY